MAGTAAADARAPPATDGCRVSCVVPVYNERENLPRLLRELLSVFEGQTMAAYRPYEIIFVEDESTDGTASWIDDAAGAHEAVRAVHLRRNWGQSAALAAGFAAAQGEIIVPMDGDLQNDPADIPQLLEQLGEGYDCVSGWRRDREDPWHKTIPSAIQTRLATLTGPDIHDFGCTLTAYRREALADIDLYGEGHRYIPAKLHKKGYSVTEVEVNHRPRQHGESRYGVGRLVRGFVDLVWHLVWNRYSTRPMHLLGGAGLLCLTAGGLLGVGSLFQRFLLGVALAPKTPRLILTALLIIFGVQLVIFGFLMEFLTAMYYREEQPYRVERVVG